MKCKIQQIKFNLCSSAILSFQAACISSGKGPNELSIGVISFEVSVVVATAPVFGSTSSPD